MLRIKRCARESLMINDDIEVIVIDVKDGVVEIGINAPLKHRVLRREIYQQTTPSRLGEDE